MLHDFPLNCSHTCNVHRCVSGLLWGSWSPRWLSLWDLVSNLPQASQGIVLRAECRQYGQIQLVDSSEDMMVAGQPGVSEQVAVLPCTCLAKTHDFQTSSSSGNWGYSCLNSASLAWGF